MEPIIKSYPWGMPWDKSIISLFSSSSSKIASEAWWVHDKFILKIISIENPLSIQVHPNQTFATSLSQINSFLYDPFPKPEIAIAITSFRALCGFLPKSQIIHHVNKHSLLFNIIDETQDVIQLFYKIITDQSLHLLNTIKSNIEKFSTKDQVDLLVLDLMNRFPYDNAVLCPYFLNYIELKPGWALIIPPGIIHSYLSGQAVECMPPSDNVIRIGLTSKYCDYELFKKVCINSSDQEPIITPPRTIYSHPCFSEYFQLYRFNGNTTINSKGTVIVFKGEGLINGKKQKKGFSCTFDEKIMIIGDNIEGFIAYSPTE